MDEEDPRPTLKGIIFDMTAVANLDVTATQVLVDVREQFERHTAPDPVFIHFAGTRSPWTRRALVSAGFGHSSAETKTVFSVAPSKGGPVLNEEKPDEGRSADVEKRLLPINSVDRRELILHALGSLSDTVLFAATFNTDIDEALTAILINLNVIEDKTAQFSPPSSSNSSANHLPMDGAKGVTSSHQANQAA